MKNFQKAVVGVLAIATLFSAGACNPGNSGQREKVDKNKAQLHVFNYDGGVGHLWLEKVIERFEEEYKDTVFVEGTTGVQVWVNNKKIGGDALATTIPSSRDDVFFVENLNYLNYAYSGTMLDISDIVNEPLSEWGETKSIADKMTEQQKSYYNLNGTYYALPHYNGFNGISYDVDLFDQKNLFFTENGTIGAKSTSKNLSVGVDGKKGTYDDGLPATYEQFFELCDKIVSYGMTPISWSGYYQFYFSSLMTALAADYAEEEAINFYDFNGTSKNLIESIDANGNITLKPETVITEDNGYEMYNHAGLYYALKFCETIIKKNYYAPSSFNGTCTHETAQDNFLLSRFTPDKDIAMLVEGSWWQSEATSTFTMMEESYINAGRMDRRIGFMPFPKATEEKLQSHQTYIKDDNYTVRFINANCDEKIIPLAKKFLQFCCTDESLSEFTTITSCMLGYDYELEEGDYDQLSYFAKSVYNLRQNAKVIYPYSSSEFFYKNKTALTDLFSTTKYQQPTRAMKDSGVSAEEYFELVRDKFSKEKWNTMK